MRNAEHNASPATPPKTGLLATLCSHLHTKGTGAPSSRRAAVTLAALAATLGALAFTAAPALAATPETPEAKPASAITATTATLNGVLNPGGKSEGGSYQFSYAPSTELVCSGGGVAPLSPALSVGAANEAVSVPIGELQPKTEYAVCLTAFSLFFNEPSEPSPAVTFETPPAPPSIDAESASGVSSTAATLEAQVNPENEKTTYFFEYSTSEAEVLAGKGTKVPGAPPAAELENFGGQPATVATGAVLAPGTTYFYRVVAENAQSETELKPVAGTVQSFTTVPTPKTEAVTAITATTATFNGTLTPLNATVAAEYSFDYRVGTECTGESATTPASAGTGSGAKAVSTAVTGLQPGATYSVCLVSQNPFGSELDPAAPQVTFTTPAAAPTVDSESTSGVTPFKATLEAQVNPNNQTTTYSFEYATEAAKIGTPAATVLKGNTTLSGFGDQTASAPTGHVLTPATTYFYRVIAENAAHEKTEGKTEEFTTPAAAAPVIESEASSQITAEHARLEATINPENQETTCSFEYASEEAQLGKPAATTVPCTAALGTGGAGVAALVNLTGLNPASTYYYRVTATNATGPTQGAIEHFETLPAEAPKIEEPSVTDVTSTAATLNAELNPGGLKTTYTFELAPAAASFTPVTEPEGTGTLPEATTPSNLTVHIQHGLTPNTNYEFRLTAHNTLETTTSTPVAFTTQRTGGELVLPDARQYEMVTPPDKHGALFEAYQSSGPVVLQASVHGDAIVDTASQPSEPEPQGFGEKTQVLSTRGPSGWSLQSLGVPRAAASGPAFTLSEYHLFSADLSLGVTQEPGQTFTALSPAASEATPYLHTDYLHGNPSEHCEASYLTADSCFQPLVTRANDTTEPFQPFGEEIHGHCPHESCGPHFVDATPDMSHIILRSSVQLTATSGSGFYEWSSGQLQPLPAPPAALENLREGDLREGVKHEISDNGQRVVLATPVEGVAVPIFLRDTNLPSTGDPNAQTTLAVGTGTFQTASADDSRIFFVGAEGDLFEYDLEKPESKRVTDLTVDPHAGEAAGVKHVIGTSEDGSYVYFTAAGALTPNAGKSKCEGERIGNGEVVEQEADTCNVYLRHDGVTTLVAPAGGLETEAQVSSDGRWLAFMSDKDLTHYDTRDAVNGHLDQEVYLYGADANRLVCASCDPTGARPSGILTAGPHGNPSGLFVGLASSLRSTWVASSVPRIQDRQPDHYQARYLADGGRLFFDSDSALVPQDVNGAEDVYQYEPAGFESAEGKPQCTSSSATFGERSDGCVGLISSGTSAQDSAFLDASEDGGDVFFLSTAKLAPQDLDTAYDIYDAHVCTSTSPCIPPPVAEPPACVTEASCKAAPTPQPSIFGASGSATFSGQGNITSTPAIVKPKTKAVKCKKGFVKNRKGKCIKNKKKNNKHKAKKSAKGRA